LSFEYDRYAEDHGYSTITYTLRGAGYADIFRINTQTNHVEREINIENDNQTVTSSLGYTSAGSPPPLSGHRYLSLTAKCRACQKYDYTLQLIVALQPVAMKEIILNSERVIFQADRMSEAWELKNIYTTKLTVYSRFSPPVIGANAVRQITQQFPLLPLDRNDPTKTLKRVKNLLIFT